MIVKITNVAYDPQVDCSLWKQFIREIMDYKPDLTHFMQTAAGWAVTGDILEQIMFILYETEAAALGTFDQEDYRE